MNEAMDKRYRQMLRDSLLNVATDVPELLNHLSATFPQILELSDLDGAVIKTGATMEPRQQILQNLGIAYRLSEKTLIDLDQGVETEWVVLCAMECERLLKRSAGWCLGVELGNSKSALISKSNAARKAADALHNKPGGTRDKQTAIRAAWASGKYSSRDLCAEQECAALDMAPGTARKALRNTPNPV